MDTTERGSSRRWWLKYALGFGVFTLLGLFDAWNSYWQYAARNDPLTVPQALAMFLSLWYAWGILAVFVFALARRFPFDPRAWVRWLLLHLAAGVFFTFVKILMDYPIIKLFYCPDPGWMPLTKFFRMAFVSQFYTYVLIYWAMVGVSHAFNYYRKYHERELKASQLEARLAQAQLQLLKMQLHPHFLFNTLNAISALIHKNPEQAERMLARLGDLLRLTLEKHGVQEVVLREELDFLWAYLEIEQVRFGPRLTVAKEIDPEVLDARVPYLILQPLVENAIRHGVMRNGQRGRVEVRARRDNGVLRLEVQDNGPGPTPGNGPTREGVGLANTRARLRQLYGDGQRFELRAGAAGGAVATVEIPFREEVEARG